MELHDFGDELVHCHWCKSGQGEGGIEDTDNAVDQEFGNLAN